MLDSSPEDEDFPGRLLHQAALWDNEDLLEDLLRGENCSLINSQDSWGRTPLHAAAITDKSKCLRILLQSGVNPDIQCGPRGENRTALHLAAEHGHEDNVRLLLEFNASMLVRDANGMTAYDIADKCGHESCMTILKDAADTREKARQERHLALREACCISEDANLVRKILSSIPETDIELVVNMAPGGANTLLFTAAQLGRKELVKILLDYGADGRIHPVTRYSPLYIACYHGFKDVVEILLQKFPELVQIYTVERWLPIHAACINGHTQILELLFSFNYPQKLLKTLEISKNGNVTKYRMAFDVNMLDVTGQSVLYVACLLGNYKTVETILSLKVPEMEEPNPDLDPETQTNVSKTERKLSAPWTTFELQKTFNKMSPVGLEGLIDKNPVQVPPGANLEKPQPGVIIEKISTPSPLGGKNSEKPQPGVNMEKITSPGPLGGKNSEKPQPGVNTEKISTPSPLGGKNSEKPQPGVNTEKISTPSPLGGKISEKPQPGVILEKITTSGPLGGKNSTAQNPDPKKLDLKAQKVSGIIEKLQSPDSDSDTFEKNSKRVENVEKSQMSPTKRRISHGIQSIMSRLSLSKSFDNDNTNSNSLPDNLVKKICPIDLDQYCNNGSETALHAAVKGGHFKIVEKLLISGASPNLFIRGEDINFTTEYDDFCFGKSTALVEACRLRNLQMAELLLSYGARDDECRALGVSVRNKDEILTAKLLSIKANPDPENKINKRAMTEENGTFSQLGSVLANFTTTYSSIFPSQAVMINWHNQRCRLSQIRPQWLVDAALTLNQKLRQNPRCQEIALYAITRLDVSSNSLVSLPPEIFKLASLRYLNIAQNKIERLPLPEESKLKRRRSNSLANRSDYKCPMLEELYAQDNRLEELPEALFRLPSLQVLVVSNNKLQKLPYEMWNSPKLKELNASFNLLKELPVEYEVPNDRLSFSSSDSHLSSHSSSVCEEDEFLEIGINIHSREKNVVQLEPTRPHLWCKSVEITETVISDNDFEEGRMSKSSQLSLLNLAHNMFTSVPSCLACLAVNLTRLNMSFNSLRSMSHITNFPNSLKQLDLSHNQISCWPSLPQIPRSVTEPPDPSVACYSVYPPLPARVVPLLGPGGRPSSIRNAVLQSVCVHRRHLRLENLRTLILAGNRLHRIQLTTDDEMFDFEEVPDTPEPNLTKNKLIFPNLSMLDIADNNLREVPPAIHELTNLSVLNISGNIDIGELPPQMGLLGRLWNLNTRGCQLHEPLRSMISSKKYKTMDIVGYLKSVLEDAKPYARMKLMIVGVQGIGKTSLLEQLRHEGGFSKNYNDNDWARRMGNQTSTPSRKNISTVGVDIGDWVCDRKGSKGTSKGPVTFRTWDFGGQREYYATHQYFLSKRSLYLVTWRIMDGQKGISEILQWLVNIQARAPNSPVIIVGTHYDLVQELISPQKSEMLQQIIRERFINVVDAEKCGLPRVLDTIEVSCKTRHNIRLLCNLIYDTAFSLRPPGSKEPLLEQRVPASYLALEDVISYVAIQRKQIGLDPVLSSSEYRNVVTAEMQARGVRPFRDISELHQATLFLHDNGVLLHYDDATLKDLYFLDPQWLCDMLAHVVTVREINPFARTGVMRLEDLRHVFKASGALGPVDHGRGYIVSLLNKFEVALTWDSRTLLIPSLLPSEEEIFSGAGAVTVRVPVRSRGRQVRGKKHVTVSPRSLQYVPNEVVEPETSILVTKKSSLASNAITRLLLMSYFPSGFWSRLVSRILADDTIVDIVRSYFIPPKESSQEPNVVKALLELKSEWCLWQTGLQLRYGEATLLRMREVPRDFFQGNSPSGSGNVHIPNSPTYRAMRFRLRQDGQWCDVDLMGSSILEIHFPMDSLLVGDLEVPPGMEAVTQLLALAVDHIDTLLEDWYPTLGTRFVHTSEGRFLVTRLVPCPDCLAVAVEEIPENPFDKIDFEPERMPPRMSQESYTSETDSGVGGESNRSSRTPSVEGRPQNPQNEESSLHFSWMIEECILAAHSSTRTITCPTHGEILLSRISPDVIFLDLGERYLIRPESIKRGRLLGRGAFGFVFRGTCKSRGSQTIMDVAMKMLQPVQPGSGARQSAVVAFKAAQGKWERDPLQYACKAYCTARQELAILLSLRHPNIVPLIGVCASPLALVLDLAPRGALDGCLRHYRRSGARLYPETLRQLVLQTARAIEYLHRQRIIYRDLKSENVLVWQLPEPFQNSDTHVKLADYGISRMTLPGGAKGFGGTEGFMAPEIMRHNGEEEYTEKVDCFSFGMYIYELLTLRQPFEGHESVKECILEGGRPPLTRRQVSVHPPHCLDLMVLCWSQNPKDRPSASQIVSIASAPEFSRLLDVIPLKHNAMVSGTVAGLGNQQTPGTSNELWLTCANNRVDLLLIGGERGSFLQYHSFGVEKRPTALCLVTVQNSIWVGDSSGRILVYSANDCTKTDVIVLSESDDLEDEKCAVRSMVYAVGNTPLVAVALGDGRLLTLDLSGKVLAELNGVGTPLIHSLCVVPTSKKIELWAGGARLKLGVYLLGDKEDSPMFLEHAESSQLQPDDSAAVLNIVCDNSLEKVDTVWTYIYPGCVVYQWDVTSKRILNRLDCSKLVPCSESLKSIAIEEHLSPGRCQVTSLQASGEELYIGTTWGCLIVAERSSMRPITVFRPHEEDIRAVVPLNGKPLIATIGRGYRPLLNRYVDSNILDEESATVKRDCIFVMLWKADNWATL